MFLSSVSLAHFRNHEKKMVTFSPTATLLVGPNGIGKTNILEAIAVLAQGESFRAGDSGEMVGFESEVAHMSGEIVQERILAGGLPLAIPLRRPRDRTLRALEREPGSRHPSAQESISSSLTTVHMVLTRGIVQGKRVAKIKYLVNGVARQKSDFIGHLKVVLFEPESLEIVIGDPGHRRRFLDGALSQTSQEYAQSISVYAKALRTRNRVLQMIREGKAKAESLEFWEREMVKHGNVIQDAREEMVEWLNNQVTALPSQGQSLQGLSFLSIQYDASVMSEERLDQYRDREIAAGFTLVGPQRDDLQISYGAKVMSSEFRLRLEDTLAPPESSRLNLQLTAHNSYPLSSFGSRGQQRMAVLKLKLLEAEWIEKKTNDVPIILLDDIFSELDEKNEELVHTLISKRQAIITATDVRDIAMEATILKLF